jgi:uncharacterized SAM-binding protein YcdF (DUF218 family)
MMELLVHPLGVSWVVLWALLITGLRRRPPAGSVAIGIPLLLLGLFGATPLPLWLLARWEAPYVQDEARREAGLADSPRADAVVVLGGTHAPRPETLLGMDLADAGDRILTGVELSRRLGGLPVVFTGGDWEKPGEPRSPVSRLVEDWLAGWGALPGEVIHVWPCGNTRDEAVATRRLMDERDWQRVWLVTSSSHMRRAEATFRAAGVDVLPMACEFHGTSMLASGEGWRWVPHSQVLALGQMWVHEVLGWGAYRWRGWL